MRQRFVNRSDSPPDARQVVVGIIRIVGTDPPRIGDAEQVLFEREGIGAVP